MKNGRKINFRGFYVIYLTLLILTSASVLIYIHSLLQKYENFRPQHYVSEVMEELRTQAASHILAETYGLEKPVAVSWEQGDNFWEEYENDFLEELDIKLYKSTDKEVIYTICNGDFSLARVTLETKGEPYTRLAILQFQEWEVKTVELVFEPHFYELLLPEDYKLTMNGKPGEAQLTQQPGLVKYSFENLYRKPDITIENADCRPIEVRVSDKEIRAVFYEYQIVLPAQIKVYCNDGLLQGEKNAENMVTYRISDSVKPDVRLEDLYGNSTSYDGKGEVELTRYLLSADTTHSVTVDGMEVASEVCSLAMNPEYEFLTAYVDDIPEVMRYDIAVLKSNPEIVITNAQGERVEALPGSEPDTYVAQVIKEDNLPQEITDKTDVLENAKNWSLFMSNDLAFSGISSMLLKDSYQYDVARKYATGVDITFTSAHTLKNPPFTEEKVSNYVRISPNCFSVDISFVKHMSVGAGKAVDDAMNDRFYYVRVNDETGETWKLVGMKEIVNDGE